MLARSWNISNLMAPWPTPRFNGKLTWVRGFLEVMSPLPFSSIDENLTALGYEVSQRRMNAMT